jgi:DNA polymerase-1
MSTDYRKIFEEIEKKKEETLHKNSKVLIVDSLNTFLRSFAAIHHINPSGNHIGGLAGYLKSVGSVIKHIEPTRVVLVFDGQGGSTNKRYLYPEYKTNRHITKITNWDAFDTQEEESEAITAQIIRLIEYLKCLPVDLIAIDKIEADDVIGYIAQRFPEKVVILSTDQDYLQLVNENISVFSPVKKTIYYPETVKKEFGIPSYNFLTHKVIVGDKGDNVPGVKGIQIKTLIKMFPEIGDERVELNEIIDKCKDKSGKFTDIYNYRHQLSINKQLMDLINPNIPEEDVERLDRMITNPRNHYDPQCFQQLCKEDQLGKSLLNPQVWLSETFGKLTQYKLQN